MLLSCQYVVSLHVVSRPRRQEYGATAYSTAAEMQERTLAALTDWVLAHRRLVVVFWLAAAVAGAASASSATHALSQRSALPGKPGYQANQLIQRLYGNGGATAPFIAVLSLPSDQRIATPSTRAAIGQAMRALQKYVPGSRVVSYASTADRRFVSPDGRTTFALVYPPSQPDGQNPVIGALAVLAFVFGSLLAFVPLLIAAVAIPTCFLIIWGITSLTPVFFVVQYLVALIGLGVAIDYSLLIVVRWREERAHGADNQEAVR